MKRERTPIRLFIVSAAADAVFQTELEKHLVPLWQRGLLEHWQSVHPGDTIENVLREAKLIVLLLSADFNVDASCQEWMQRALERQKEGEITVLPILLRPVELTDVPFAHLTMVPTTRQAVTRWTNQDEAWAHIAEAIGCVLEGKPLPHVGAAKEAVSAPAEKQVWMVPFARNPFFTGREEVLEDLHEHFHQGQVHGRWQALALSGVGGSGKTQIMVEYAYRFQQEYPVVLWVQADSYENIVASYGVIAHEVQLPEREGHEPMKVVQAVKRWLMGTESRWLLLLDNVEELALVPDFLPSKWQGHILFTTQVRVLGGLARRAEVRLLEPGMGVRLLLRRADLVGEDRGQKPVSPEEVQAATTLVEDMGGLPLALDQAGAYIEETHCHVSDYLAFYQQHGKELLAERGQSTLGHPDSVMTTISLSLKKVLRIHPGASDLLKVLAFLYPERIPIEILTESAVGFGPLLTPVVTDPFAFEQAMEVLLRFSLIQRDREEQTITLHRLIQQVIRARMSEGVQQRWVARVLEAVSAVGIDPTWQRYPLYLAQVMACAALVEEWDSNSTSALTLLSKMGGYLHDVSRFEEATRLFKQALKIAYGQPGSHALLVASLLDRLASSYQDWGKYSEAEPLFLQALEIKEQELGGSHPETATSVNHLAGLYKAQGRYAEAEPLRKRALEISEQELGPRHPETATSVNNLALLYHVQGKYSKAEPLYLRALGIYERELGGSHPDTARSLNNLAGLYDAQGRYAEAEPLYTRALGINEQALGGSHPDTAASLNNLAALYHDQRRYGEAEVLHKRALGIRERVLGSEHPDTVSSLNNLAALYATQGKYGEAEPLYLRALAIREQELGPEHPDTARSLNNLAALYHAQGKYSEAEPLFESVLEIREQSLGGEHPDTATTLFWLAVVAQQQQRSAEALGWYARAWGISKRVLGVKHPRVSNLCKQYAGLLRELGREEEATALEAEED